MDRIGTNSDQSEWKRFDSPWTLNAGGYLNFNLRPKNVRVDYGAKTVNLSYFADSSFFNYIDTKW